MSSIQAKSLSKSYNSVNAVDSIDINVDSGQIFGFLGPNGAGKSTTIKLLTTLIPPTEGSLQILGIDAIKNPLEVRQKIGVVLQEPSYEPNLTVEKSIEKYGMMWNVPKNIRKIRTNELISYFELEEIRHKKNEDLSIGQRRRVQLAREFIHDMELLFLDEPTVGLDPYARRSLLNFLKKKASEGLTIFYTTHVLTEAEYLCDNIAIINKGKIMMIDSPDELKKKFGNQKTIKIHISSIKKELPSLFSNIKECKIEFNSGSIITIHSDKPELLLMKTLQILNENNIDIENLSAIPTSLEDIFLKMVNNNDSSNN